MNDSVELMDTLSEMSVEGLLGIRHIHLKITFSVMMYALSELECFYQC